MFSHRVHFVHHDLDDWADICSEKVPPPPEAYARRLREGNDNWVVQTYLELKRRSLNVEILPHPVAGEICVAHYDDIKLKEVPTRCFLVGVRGDRPDIHVSRINIVQNQSTVRRNNEYFIPHWSQPGLIPRDPSRGNVIKTIGYIGIRINLHPVFLTPEFNQGLCDLGVALHVREHPYQDYSDLDLVLAVRPGTKYDIDLKPASKLQNAWLAGCPALLGPESAYRQYRKSNLDYIEVSTPDDVLRAIRRLQADPGIYSAMVENGRNRAAEYSHDSIANQWINLFAGTVMPLYEQWRASRPRFRWVELAQFSSAALHHKLARYHHRRSI